MNLYKKENQTLILKNREKQVRLSWEPPLLQHWSTVKRYNGFLGTRVSWPLYWGGCYTELHISMLSSTHFNIIIFSCIQIATCTGTGKLCSWPLLWNTKTKDMIHIYKVEIQFDGVTATPEESKAVFVAIRTTCLAAIHCVNFVRRTPPERQTIG